ncbi:Uncharacterised protein [Mycobacteroides abscessus subsp. abscessus]|uniref:hypothetical protein n=1 Tax=Mycobacteroides abscessus TaxID=36809 RepID=UPI0009D41701|nr:hypothetical protein [Mycobacteroides abscessus]SKD92090.1 Uncharacterised protein [Mycobacteroides abscessus subsp. abscessus]
MTTPTAVIPIDESRACRMALGVVKADPAITAEALDEAQADGRVPQLILALLRNWTMTAAHYMPEHVFREALQAAVFDAELAQESPRTSERGELPEGGE